MPSEEQFAGCLIGQALGDALGFIVEGRFPGACQEYVDTVVRMGRAHECRRGPFPFGQYSDDSQLARELLQSYVACGAFDPEDYASRIAAIFQEERIVGRGRATEKAAMRLAWGAPWQEAGTPPPSAGNGSAMRAGPIGLFFYDDLGALVRAAHDQGRITHQDPRCSAGSVVIAGAVALALEGAPADPASFLERLSDLAAPFPSPFPDTLMALTEWLSLEQEQAATLISRAGLDEGFADVWQGISPFVVGSVLWSLYAFLRSPEDYVETISTAIAVGGDVDTTGAMAGAISGACNGLDALPQELLPFLNDQGSWKAEDLKALAVRAYAIKMGLPS